MHMLALYQFMGQLKETNKIVVLAGMTRYLDDFSEIQSTTLRTQQLVGARF